MIGVRDAAKRLGVSESTLRSWLREGILPYYQLHGKGGKIFFQEGELSEFIAQRKVNSAEPEDPATEAER